MEINITKLVKANNPQLYSASIAEIGNNAGPLTWNRALSDGMDLVGITDPDQLEELREYFAAFGAWDEDEINTWTIQKMNALLLQDIAGTIRENGLNNPEFNSVFQDDDGEWYYYVGP
jgi:hypothetical protein